MPDDPNAAIQPDPAAAPAAPVAPAPAAPAPSAERTAPPADPAAAPAAAPQPDWRTRISGGDKTFLTTLERFSDEAAFGTAYRAMVQKMSSGELVPAPTKFPEKGTDAEKAEWRKANAVPDKTEGYIEAIKLPKGMVPGDNDKPGLEQLAQIAQAKNWDTARYNDTLEVYYDLLDKTTAARDAADDQFHQSSEDALRGDWGNDYRRNVNAFSNFVNGAPENVREQLFGGRGADGRLIGDNPVIVKWFTQVAMDLNPAASVLPPNIAPTQLNSRMAELAEMRKNPDSEYYVGPNARKLQEEELKLIEAHSLQSNRSKAA